MNSWVNNRVQIRQITKSTDRLERFTKEPVIRKTMYLQNSEIINKEWEYICNSEYFYKLKYNVNLDKGKPDRFSQETRFTTNYVHAIYHIILYCEKMEIDLFKFAKYAIEFGGGYGDMCKFMSQYVKWYEDFDFPELYAIHQYYNDDVLNKAYIKDINEVRVRKDSLFIACWSLSEVPCSIRSTSSTAGSDQADHSSSRRLITIGRGR